MREHNNNRLRIECYARRRFEKDKRRLIDLSSRTVQ